MGKSIFALAFIILGLAGSFFAASTGATFFGLIGGIVAMVAWIVVYLVCFTAFIMYDEQMKKDHNTMPEKKKRGAENLEDEWTVSEDLDNRWYSGSENVNLNQQRGNEIPWWR